MSVTASVPGYQIEPDFSNVENSEDLIALPDDHKKLLVQNGFLVSTCPALEMYSLYVPGQVPFITADCVFHAYHVLLTDTLSNIEEAVLVKKLELLVAGAHKAAIDLRADVPAKLKVPADSALVFWAVAHRLMIPDAVLAPEIREDVAAEVTRIVEGSYIGNIAGEERMRDYTVYRPIAGYERNENMQRYFRCSRYLTLTPVEFRTPEQAQACALVSLAIFSDRKTQRAYEDLIGLSRFLAGDPEDVSPLDVLTVLRSIFGKVVSPEKLAEEETAGKLQAHLAKLKQPSIADQPQERPGADPSTGWGMRVLPPGVSIRAKAFQKLGENLSSPSGGHVLYLLGNKANPLDKSQENLLASTREMVLQSARRYNNGLDVHTSALVALSKLSGDRNKGYPMFMRGRDWTIKTANTQLGAWSQVEHDVFLYAKNTNYYLCGNEDIEHFHGYIEPEPEYYAILGGLVARTRIVFERLKAFKSIQALAKKDPNAPNDRRAIVATATHYKKLEEMLLTLKTMSEKELTNKPFNKSEIAFLKDFKDKIKYLAFNESNIYRAWEPMSSIVRISREYSNREDLYVGTGRPLQILVIVPWQGKLYWCKGAIYSYYEFMNLLTDPISDASWKRETSLAFAYQKRRPWLFQQNLGLAQRTICAMHLQSGSPNQVNTSARVMEGLFTTNRMRHKDCWNHLVLWSWMTRRWTWQ